MKRGKMSNFRFQEPKSLTAGLRNAAEDIEDVENADTLKPEESVLSALPAYLSAPRRRLRAAVRRFCTSPLINLLLSPEVYGKQYGEELLQLSAASSFPGAYIVVANHSSHLDAPMLFALLPSEITARLATGAAADYFYKNRVVAALTSLFFNTYPVKRHRQPENLATPNSGAPNPASPNPAAPSDANKKIPGFSEQLLRAGVPILLFPEGTRSRSGKLGEFHSGAAALAQQLEIPILPVAMRGGRDVMPVGAKFPKLGKNPVEMHIGQPLLGQPGETATDFTARLKEAIATLIGADIEG